MNIRIRAAKKEDVDRIITINRPLAFCEQSVDESYIRSIYCNNDSQDYIKGFVAIKDKKIVGFIGLITRIPLIEIEILTVDKGVRRCGIGTALINFAKKYAKANKCHKIIAGSYIRFKATKFYLKKGFKLLEEDDDGLARYRDFCLTI